MTTIAVAIQIHESSLAPSPDLELPTEPAEHQPSADAAALRSTPQGYLSRFVALNNQLDAAALGSEGEVQGASSPDAEPWKAGNTQLIGPAAQARFRKPQHDLDASRRGKLRFWTWCACGHVYTVPGECVHCVGSGIQKPETD